MIPYMQSDQYSGQRKSTYWQFYFSSVIGIKIQVKSKHGLDKKINLASRGLGNDLGCFVMIFDALWTLLHMYIT